MYPLIGKKVFIDYDHSKYNVNYLDATVMKIDGSFGDTPVRGVVEYKSVLVDKNIYMVFWFEEFSKMSVTQVQNFNTLKVYTNIVNVVTSEFYHLRGKMTIMKNNNESQTPPTTTTTTPVLTDPLQKTQL